VTSEVKFGQVRRWKYNPVADASFLESCIEKENARIGWMLDYKSLLIHDFLSEFTSERFFVLSKTNHEITSLTDSGSIKCPCHKVQHEEKSKSFPATMTVMDFLIEIFSVIEDEGQEPSSEDN